jgi:hypothetical protein
MKNQRRDRVALTKQNRRGGVYRAFRILGNWAIEISTRAQFSRVRMAIRETRRRKEIIASLPVNLLTESYLVKSCGSGRNPPRFWHDGILGMFLCYGHPYPPRGKSSIFSNGKSPVIQHRCGDGSNARMVDRKLFTIEWLRDCPRQTVQYHDRVRLRSGRKSDFNWFEK